MATLTALLAPTRGIGNPSRKPYMQELTIDLTAQAIDCSSGDIVQCITIPGNTVVLSNFHGFRVYSSSNLPAVGTGPGTSGSSNQNVNFGVLVAGHDSAVATAEQINKTESYRDPDSFADIVRGMHLYGRKILRPEAIVTAKYNAA